MRFAQIRIPLVMMTVASLLAQQSAPPPSQAAPQTAQAPIVLKSVTRLVQVSVNAQDGKGQPVTDLKKEDFQIKVNGKEQPIKVFSMESSGALPHSDVTLPPNIFTNRLEAKAGAPSAVTIILLDSMNTRMEDQIYTKAQVIRYLRTLEPGDHIGLYVLGNSLRVLHDYTADSSEVLRRLEELKGKDLPDTSKGEAMDAMHGDALMLDAWQRGMGGVSPAERSFYTVNRVLGTLKALEFIANHLAKVPGRKNLIWVSGGFPLDIGFDNLAAWHNPQIEQRTFTEEVTRTVQAINDANMAIYPVDARGLMVDPRFNAENRNAAFNPKHPESLKTPVGVKNQQTMEELASRTGGKAFYNTNDLAKAIHNAVDDSRVTYTLGFYPVEEAFDGKFHKIDVHVAKSGVHLRYRKGYFDLPEHPQDEESRKAQLHDAAWSPLDASGIGMAVKVQASKTKPGTIEIVLAIDSTQIGMEQQADRWVGRLDILYVQRDNQGNQFSGIDDTVNLRLPEETYKKLLKEGLVYGKSIDRADRAKVLRIIVRDSASGAIGSITVPMSKIT